MRLRLLENRVLLCLTLCLPFILAYASWRFFPVLADWLVTQIFGYPAVQQPPNPLWLAIISFFYAWYTFLAIGVAGVWALIATYTRIKQSSRIKKPSYPMVSFIIPAYNEEKNVSRCINSLFKCAEKYDGLCEIIVVDDGSTDYTYEMAWATIELNRKKHPATRAKVVRHTSNLGKIEAIKTGVSKALGSLIAVVDADSCWKQDTLVKLVDYMLLNGKKAVTGYVHPTGDEETSPYIILQQLEYSQGLGIARCAQSLGDKVLVVSGAIGLYDAETLHKIFAEKSLRSVTDDLEITLEMHKRGANVGYVSTAKSITVAPTTLSVLWSQRLRWFTGWLHNTLEIHKDLLLKRSWLTLLLWYCYIFEYGGAFIDIAAITAFPFIFWFAPDRIHFILNLLIFAPYGLMIGVINQAIALKYAYNNHNYRALLFYTPFYPIIRFINITARLTSIAYYAVGDKGNWHTKQKPFQKL